jgi:3-deoxy-D-manno-octulosonic-acid transferase
VWRTAYQLLLVLAWPWVRLRLRWRARREPEYGARIGERFGRVPAEVPAGCVWFHTVSAGETIAAAPLVAALAAAFPDQPVLVTTMTPTGSAQVRARLGDRVHHCYAPYDFPWAVRRFYDRVRPRLLVLMETELWPNLIGAAAAGGVPVMLVNARLSARSARGYQHLGSLARDMLGRLRWIACQYPDHARRFVDLGAAPERVLTYGNVKFDLALPCDHAERVRALRDHLGMTGPPVWIAGSTHVGEEARALAAHRRVLEQHPAARLILVPRHPARADSVAALCREAGFSVARRSAPGPADAGADILLGDTMGELLYLYGLADVAFVGGSFADVGGHNPIEPALCGRPVLMGPVTRNFDDVVAAFLDAGCLRIVADGAELGHAVRLWLADPTERAALGARARQVVADNAGASERLRRLLTREIQTVRGAPGQ